MADAGADRRGQMFPELTAAQLRRISSLGERRSVRKGEILFEVGEQNTKFFVVIEGAIEVVRPLGEREEPVVLHGPGQFTGEINMLSARRSLVRGRAVGDGSVIAIDRERLRALVQRDAELSEILMRAFILRRVGLLAQVDNELVLLGSPHSGATLRLKEFLTRNAQPFTYHDIEGDPAVQALLDRFHVGVSEIPVVLCQAGKVLRNPSIELLAAELGLSTKFDAQALRDVVIVGAGPAGLAAAVYAASEGLDVLVLEATAPGGQAGTSSRIENYLGFPTGISGEALAARALTQAEKFGAELAIAQRAVRLRCDQRTMEIELGDGQRVRSRTVVIASGAQYRKPELPELSRFEGAGVYYSATHMEAQICKNEDVAIVGGGNSAGQAAVYLAQSAASVRVLIRGPGLAESMSRYLIRRLEDSPNIELLPRTVVEALAGTSGLEQLRWRQLDTGQTESRPMHHLFLMTGALPNTQWLKGCVVLDDKGFVKAGADLRADELSEAGWPLARAPYLAETSLPRVFVVGDARSGSVKRVASAVGEGSVCVQLIHRALAEL
jgi:thioredoxin reductase (NADPH)